MLGNRTGVRATRTAALHAEVIALRATVSSLRRDLDSALARGSELAARLSAEAALTTPALLSGLPVQSMPPVTLELPLVRLALQRVAEPPLTREMAVALASPDRGEDSALVEIVLADLPEHALLDPRADRDGELRDLAVEIATAPEVVRRTA